MGDHIAYFDKDELVLIGPNLPHFWKNDEDLDPMKAKAFVLHFRGDFLGERYMQLPEAHNISKLFDHAQSGLKITGETNNAVRSIIENLSSYVGFERLLMLQKMLSLISESGEVEPLASPGFVSSFKTNQEERINKVYEYVMYNFQKKITLQDISSVAFMTEVAFCSYFKSRTGKSFFNFLNDIRIGYACRLLLEGDMNITEICYESGFNNLSYFNRQFKDHTKETPQQYREIFKR